MRRAAAIFLAAILLPCLGLAWLAVRSAQDQQVIMEHQQAIIDQGVADSFAQNVRAQMDAVTVDFVQTTQQMLAAAGSPQNLAEGFHQKLCGAWPLAEVGFAVDLHGTLYAPARTDGRAARLFREENGSFLSNRTDAEVYLNTQATGGVLARNDQVVMNSGGSMAEAQARAPQPTDETATTTTSSPVSASAAIASKGNVAPASPPVAMATATGRTTAAEDVATAGSAIPLPDQSSSAIVLRDQNLKRVAEIHDEDQLEKAKNAASTTPPGAASKSEEAPDAEPAPAAASFDLNAPQEKALQQKVATATSTAAPSAPSAGFGTGSLHAALAPQNSPPIQQQQLQRIARQVAPQESTRAPDAALSSVVPAQSDFRQLIGQSTSGSVARFLDDKLCLLVWSLPAHDSIVFGAQLNQDRLIDRLRSLVTPEANRSDLDTSFGARADYCLALIDDQGKPVAQSQPGFRTDWKHPFVATEIGGVLPHWEAALYLTNPGQVSHSARVLHFTIGLIIAVLIVAILAGGTLIGADVGRQMRLAQQKTDFVSNVSHELKTPLTSIRMFADMLAEGRVEEPEKRATYLHIISAESARLTRLINNVLDFARMERGAPAGERHACDLVELTRDVVETCQPHLAGSSVSLTLDVEAESLELMADRDALSQIVLNLISNAEKYGGGEIAVRVRRQDAPTGAMGCVDVLDRGPGIPPKQVESVFAPFHRLDDSLASGVPGSGLGLTLARRMARAHGGNVTYQPRAGGGSCFTLALPLSVSTKNRSA